MAVARCCRRCRRCSRGTPGSGSSCWPPGDPLVSGIATEIVALLGPSQVDGAPGALVGVAGPGPARLVRGVHRRRDAGGTGPRRAAEVLRARPAPAGAVLRRLDAVQWSRRCWCRRSTATAGSPCSATSGPTPRAGPTGTAATWRVASGPALNVVCVEVVAGPVDPGAGDRARAAGRRVRARRPDHQARPARRRAVPAGACARRAAVGRRRGRRLGRRRVDAHRPALPGGRRRGRRRAGRADRSQRAPAGRARARRAARLRPGRARRPARPPTPSSSAERPPSRACWRPAGTGSGRVVGWWRTP